MKKYSVPGGISQATVLTTYSVMKFFAEWTSYTAVYGMVKLHCSDDKFLYLIFLYNAICASAMLVFGLFSDRVTRGKFGVMLGAALLGMGFAFPASLGVTAKLSLCALGISAMNAFAAREISRTTGAYGLSVFAGSSVLGYGVGIFNMFYGYVAAFAAVLCAALAPLDVKSADANDKPENTSVFSKLSFPLSITGAAILACAGESANVFGRIYKRRDVLIAAFLFFTGTAAYYAARRFIENITPHTVSAPLSAAVFVASVYLLDGGIIKTAAVMISLGIAFSVLLDTSDKCEYRGLAASAVFTSLYAGHTLYVFLGGSFLLYAVILFVVMSLVAATGIIGRKKA